VEWNPIYFQHFNLHVSPRPEIIISRRFKSRLLMIELSKIGGWDYKQIAWLTPVIFTPQGKTSGRWKRLYIGNNTIHLSTPDLAGSIEIKPRLWIPDLTVKVFEALGFKELEETILERLDTLDSKVSDISDFVY
jgi:hypothetical protein